MEVKHPLLALLLVACGGAQAQAQTQDCPAPQLLATVKMGHAEQGSEIRTVPVSINGVEMPMVLDTGGALTQVSRKAIAELGLPLKRGGAKAFDINGRVSTHFTLIDKFGFGHLNRDKAAFLVWPEPRRPWAGQVSQDLLQPYDIEVDFAANELKMYAKDLCPGPPAWGKAPVTRIQMHNKNWHLHIPVTLDGKRYDAIFDTGSRNTIMRLPTAKRDFGLSQDSPGMELYPAINGEPSLDGHHRTFSQLSFGDITIERPSILIVPDVMNRKAERSRMARNRTRRHNADLVLPDLSLGMKVLKDFRLYIAFSEQALYVTPIQGKP
jgi:predicted aspartyl protease